MSAAFVQKRGNFLILTYWFDYIHLQFGEVQPSHPSETSCHVLPLFITSAEVRWLHLIITTPWLRA